MKKMLLFVGLCLVSISCAFGAVPPIEEKPAQLGIGLGNSSYCNCLKNRVMRNVCKESAPWIIGGAFLLKASPVVCGGACAKQLFIGGALCCAKGTSNFAQVLDKHHRTQANDQMHRD